MATVTQEIPAQTDDILKPAGQGTPVSQWWECCLPKTPSSQMKGATGPDGTSPRKQHVSFQDDHTIETVDKNKGAYNRTLDQMLRHDHTYSTAGQDAVAFQKMDLFVSNTVICLFCYVGFGLLLIFLCV